MGRCSSQCNHNAKDNQTDYDQNFDAGKAELKFTKYSYTEVIDDDDQN